MEKISKPIQYKIILFYLALVSVHTFSPFFLYLANEKHAQKKKGSAA
jgi:hypothetical protein